MLELASLGAGVMHSRSIEFAKKYGVPIHVRSSFSDAEGTWIVAEADARRLGVTVTGAALAKDEARITILGVPDRPGVVHTIFRTIAAANIVVDMIVQNVATDGTTEVSFTVAAGDLAETLIAAESGREGHRRRGGHPRRRGRQGLGRRPGDADPHRRRHDDVRGAGRGGDQHPDDHDQRDQDQRAGRSCVGRGGAPRRAPGVPAWISWDNGVTAPFTLPPASSRAPAPTARDRDRHRDAADDRDGRPGHLRRRARRSQARVTLFNVPDQPGYAARVFRTIAEAGVFVDMIVQNVEHGGQHAPVVHRAPRVPPGEPPRPRGASGRARSRSSRSSPSSRSWAWACAPTPASPPGCSAPWPSAASTSP